MESICKKEGLKFQKGALATIYQATEGDMRHALNMLQAASTLGDLTNENVNKVTGISGKAKVSEVIDTALEGDFSTARTKMIELMQVNGMSEHDFIKYANEALTKSKYATSFDALQATAEADYRLLYRSKSRHSIERLSCPACEDRKTAEEVAIFRWTFLSLEVSETFRPRRQRFRDNQICFR